MLPRRIVNRFLMEVVECGSQRKRRDLAGALTAHYFGWCLGMQNWL